MRFGKPRPSTPSGRQIHPPVPVDGGGGDAAPSAASAPAGTIPESAVIFDPSTGHHHDGTTSTAVNHGDLSNVTADQHHAQGHNLFSTDHPDVDASDTPANGDLLTYDSGASKWKATPPAAGSVYPSELGTWSSPDISALASGSDTALNLRGFETPAAAALIAYQAGVATGLAFMLSGDIGGLSQSITVTLYKNGSATAITKTLTGAGGTETTAYDAAHTVSFAQGDLLDLRAQRSVLAPSAVQLAAVLNGYYTS